MTSALKAYIEGWLSKAENDLMSAQRLLEIEPMILDTACFHCQQAVEKYLKAFLCYQEKEIERTHNIIFLLSECSEIDPIFNTIDPLNINAFSVKSRYPDDTIAPEAAEAKEFYQMALNVRQLVRERIVFT